MYGNAVSIYNVDQTIEQQKANFDSVL